MKHVIGIDLGTTNTVAALKGAVSEGEGANAGPFLPSVVALLPNGKRLVGRKAQRRLAIDPKNTIASSKRLIGRKAQSSDAKKFCSRYGYDIVTGSEDRASFKTRAGVLDPRDIAAFIVGQKLADMELLPGTVSAIVTVPSMFGEEERQATREACKMAGITNVHTVYEPVATAHAYLHGRDSTSGTFAVYDLGGGTFDMAVVKCGDAGVEIVAHGGDLYLGGDDVDHNLANWVRDQVLETQRWDLKTSAGAYTRLVEACEAAKVRLAFSKETQVDLGQVDPSAPLTERNVTLSRKQLEKIASVLIGRTFVICDQVLHEAGVNAGDVDGVFLAGGSTQLQLVREGVRSYFAQEPACAHDPMEVIAIGSSLMAQEHQFA